MRSIYWHVAPASARESILTHGLDARLAVHDWRMSDTDKLAPVAQYVWSYEPEARYQAEYAEDIPHDLWRVDCRGLTVEPDPWRAISQMTIYEDAWMVRDPIPSDRLRLVAAYGPWPQGKIRVLT